MQAHLLSALYFTLTDAVNLNGINTYLQHTRWGLFAIETDIRTEESG